MDVVSLALLTTAVGFAGCLLAIALCDLGSYTIPNSVSIALLWLFVVSAPFAPTDVSLLSHICSFLIVSAVGLVAFRFGLFGGGDVKSWAAIALWYDLHGLPMQLLGVTLIGGILGLLTLGIRRVAVCQLVQQHFPQSRLPRLLRAGEPVPYGVAITLGTALSAGHIDLFRSLSF